MESVFEGNRIITSDDNEFKNIVEKYSINIHFSKWYVKDQNEFIDNCIEEKKFSIYDTFFIEFDSENKKIKWIGLDREKDSLGSVTLYDNSKLKHSVLKEVMTFAEATKEWGLGESTLRSTVKTDRLQEGVDYKKSGKVWIITRDAMIREYGNPRK